MEHEDNNTQFANNYLRGNMDEFSLQQNQQNLVENRQIASGFGDGGIVGVADEIGVSIGGKFVEEERDEEEWKYIQEVQQSEKQQVIQGGGGGGEGVGDMDVVGGSFVGYEVGGGDGQMLLPSEVDDEEEAAIIKNDGDFSTTSNTTSTVGEEENSTAAEEEPHEMQQQHEQQQPELLLQAIDEAEPQPMLQVEMEIEATKLLAQKNNSPATAEESSLATGENCENPQQQEQQLRETHKQPQYFEEESEEISGCMFSSSSPFIESNGDQKKESDEENLNTAVAKAAVIDSLDYIDDAITTHKESARPSELDFEMHSNLNPEAKEFVPIHSNPTSPISPKSHDFVGFKSFATVQSDVSPVGPFGVDDNKENEDGFVNDDDEDFAADVGDFADKLTLSSAAISPHPNAVPRHMITSDAADDVLAQSPRKGRGFDMDAISLPPENEFDHEAAKRPHEIEQEDDDLISNGDTKTSDGVEVNMNGMEMGNDENINRMAGDSDVHDDTGAEHEMQMQETTEDYSDFQNRLDHGPETSVDLDMDNHDIMKQSFYIKNNLEMQPQPQTEQQQPEPVQDQPIEDLLNTVQPIPNDSESLDSSFAEGLLNVANKELLYVEEKEVVSNSPSTEELHMRFQNEFNAFSKESIDMNNAGHMQDSFYMQHTQAPVDTETVTELLQPTLSGAATLGTEPAHATNVVSPQDDSPLIDTSRPLGINEGSTKNDAFLTETPVATAPEETQQFTHFTNEKVANELDAHSSSQSTEEKHLREETKEDIYTDNEIDDLEHMMDDLILTHDGSLHKVNEVAKSTIPIEEDQIELITQESQYEINAVASPALEAAEKKENQYPLYDPFGDEEIFDKVEAQQQMITVEEMENTERSLLQEPFVSQEMTSSATEAIAQSPVPGYVYTPMTDMDFGAETAVPDIEEPFAVLKEHRPEVEAAVSSVENSFTEFEMRPSVTGTEVEAHASVDETIVSTDDATVSAFEVSFAELPVPEIPVSDPEVSVSDPGVPVAGPEIPESVPEVLLSDPEIPVSVPEVPVSDSEIPVSVPEVSVSDPEIPVSVPEVPVSVPEISAAELPVVVDETPILTTEATLSEVKNVGVSESELEIVSTADISTTAIAATAAVATTAAVAAVAASNLKKAEFAKKAGSAKTTPSIAHKSKVGGDAKKPTENKKPPTVAAKSTTTSSAARPRTAPSAGATKTSAPGSSEKKTSASSTTTTSATRPASVSAAARKSMASNTMSAKNAATAATKTATSRPIGPSSSNSKSTATATARNGVAAKTTAPRPATATRRPTTSTLAATAHVPAAGGAAAPKPRQHAAGAPVKPTTLGISGKPKSTLSPRVRTTTSQVSRTGAGLASTAAKSPLKAAAIPATNGVGKTSSSINNASSTNRTKTTSAGATKTFTARPAPKTTSTLTTATTNNATRRATTGNSTKTTTSYVLRKSSPSKPSAGGKMSPTKTSVAPISKIKTKDVTTLKSAAKSTTATTPTKAVAAADVVLKEKQLVDAAVELVDPPKLNGEPFEHTESGQIGGDGNHTHGEDVNGLIERGEMALMDGTVA